MSQVTQQNILKFQGNFPLSYASEGRKFQEISVLITEQGVPNLQFICDDFSDFHIDEEICLTTELPKSNTWEFGSFEEDELVFKNVVLEENDQRPDGGHGYLGKEVVQL